MWILLAYVEAFIMPQRGPQRLQSVPTCIKPAPAKPLTLHTYRTVTNLLAAGQAVAGRHRACVPFVMRHTSILVIN